MARPKLRPVKPREGILSAGVRGFLQASTTIISGAQRPIAPRRVRVVLPSKKGGPPVRTKAPPSRARVKPPSARSR